MDLAFNSKIIKFKLKKVTLDGKPRIKFHCPDCNVWGYIDEDQYNGRVSILCDCGFHKTINLREQGEFI